MMHAMNLPVARKRSGLLLLATIVLDRPRPLCTLEAISADILAVEKEAEGLLDGPLMGGSRA